jgi:hypothetical protein
VHIVGHIGNVDAHDKVAVPRFDAQGIVEIQRGLAVDGDGGQVGEVDAPLSRRCQPFPAWIRPVRSPPVKNQWEC